MLFMSFSILAQKDELSPYEQNLYNELCCSFKTLARIKGITYDTMLQQFRNLQKGARPPFGSEEDGETGNQSSV